MSPDVRASADPVASPPPGAGPDGGEVRAHRVVVIDDTPDIRDLLAMVLDRAPDFAVVGQAADGREGIDVAERERPDAVLLDLAMPVMDGLEALPHLRAALPDAAILVLSGFGAGVMAQEALDGGADGYIEKGTPVKRILDRVRKVLAAREPERGQTRPQPVLPRQATARRGEIPASESTGTDGEEVARLRRAVATTAHEIRNPVTVLRGVLEAFDEDHDSLTPERRARLLAAFQRQVQRLDSMCADMLTAAHAVRGQPQLVTEVFDILAALRDLLQDGPGVTLSHDSAIGELRVRADRGRVEQMVTNLVSNAAKYGAPPVEVHVRPASAGRVEISVLDRGPGVPEEFRARLFDEFARADTGTRIAGNGLGLFVVRHLAEAHGGRVVHADRPGGGTAFTLDLEAAG